MIRLVLFIGPKFTASILLLFARSIASFIASKTLAPDSADTWPYSYVRFVPLEISKKNFVLSSKTTSLEFFTNLKFALVPEILSPSSKIFFSPMTNMFASSTIFSQRSLETISGPIPEGSPNNIATLFLFNILTKY